VTNIDPLADVQPLTRWASRSTAIVRRWEQNAAPADAAFQPPFIQAAAESATGLESWG
jgi:hypothetical protein